MVPHLPLFVRLMKEQFYCILLRTQYRVNISILNILVSSYDCLDCERSFLRKLPHEWSESSGKEIPGKRVPASHIHISREGLSKSIVHYHSWRSLRVISPTGTTMRQSSLLLFLTICALGSARSTMVIRILDMLWVLLNHLQNLPAKRTLTKMMARRMMYQTILLESL